MSNIQQNRVAIFSDLHIGVHSNSAKWHNIALEYGDWIKKELTAKGITDIIFCGDFFDSRNEIEQSTLNTGTEFLSKLRAFNIWMIVGNHDAFYKEKSTINSIVPFRHWPNITVCDKTHIIHAQDKKLVLIPWGTPPKNIPKADIIFGHFELNGFMLNSHEMCMKGEDANDLLNKSPLIISGHFHIKDEKIFSRGKILYVGSAHELNFSDADSTKGYWILNIQTGEYEFVENTISPKHSSMLLSEMMLKKNPFENICDRFFRLVIDRNICPQDADFLFERIRLCNPYSFDIDYKVTFTPLNAASAKISQGISIEDSIKEFISLLDINNKDDVHEYIMDLYNKCK